jgi:phosphatidylglycerophosphatase A
MTASTETSTAHSTRGPKPHISLLLSTWFGLGYLPQAPGTWGSLGGLVVSLLITWVSFRRYAFILNMEREVHLDFWTTGWLPAPAHLAVAVGIAVIGVIVATRAARYAQIKDPQWVVIDEVSGQLLTYYLFFWVLPLNWKTWLLGFILFRAFDIWKPFPARQLEHLPGGWGIMADDWMAGIYAALVLRVALHFRVL